MPQVTARHLRLQSQKELERAKACDFEHQFLFFFHQEKNKSTGAFIVINTACNPDRYDEIRRYCADKGLEIDGINETPIPLQYGNHKKIYANIFLDDRAGLAQSLDILTTAMYKTRGYLNERNVLHQKF
jgi:hypothetical protein